MKFLSGATALGQDEETIFSGATFSDEKDLLAKIRDTLTDPDAGWQIVEDTIASDSMLKLKGTDNGHECFVNFSAASISDSNTIDLSIQGDVDGTGRTKEIDADGEERILTVRVKANLGRLYIAASERSFALVSIEKTHPSIPYFGGFPERKDKSDAGAWMFGDLHWRMSNKYLATAKYVGGDWREIKDFYYTNNEPTTLNTSSQGCYGGTIDSTVNIFASSQSLNINQSAYKPQQGSLDPEGKPVIEPFFLRQGQFLQGNYAHVDDEATASPRIGEVDFAVTGLASVPPGDQVVVRYQKSLTELDGTKHILYYKDTYVAGDITYQGFLIDHQESDVEI